jgi:hypothetical protein
VKLEDKRRAWPNSLSEAPVLMYIIFYIPGFSMAKKTETLKSRNCMRGHLKMTS